MAREPLHRNGKPQSATPLTPARGQVPRSDTSSVRSSSPTASSRATDSLPATPRRHLAAPGSPAARAAAAAAAAAAHLGCPFDNGPLGPSTPRTARPERSLSTSSFDVNPATGYHADRPLAARKLSAAHLAPSEAVVVPVAPPPLAAVKPRLAVGSAGSQTPPSPPRRAPPLLSSPNSQRALEASSWNPSAAGDAATSAGGAAAAAVSPDRAAAAAAIAAAGRPPAHPSPTGAAEVGGDTRISPRSLFGAAEEISCPRTAYTLF